MLVIPTEDTSIPPVQYHVVRRGENLSSIARKYNVSMEQIIRLNPQITDPDTLYTGQTLLIPGYLP
ncbi:MAG: LysM peptidoglycan-binding domain-containing protein [Thermoanaerobacteraceae bacterium]|nr:LysM peptidoglycan-binding domain-containing protein [Thermoanaerobacteraceae bacterium]